MPASKRLFTFGILMLLISLGLDQLSKSLITGSVITLQKPVIEIAPVFNLVLVWNYGISFGLFAAQRKPFILIALSALILSILVTWLYKNTSRTGAFALGLIMGGAVGNVVDRLRFGAVVDFLDFHWGLYHWPAFNIADSCIFIGVVLLCGGSMFTPRHQQP